MAITLWEYFGVRRGVGVERWMERQTNLFGVINAGDSVEQSDANAGNSSVERRDEYFLYDKSVDRRQHALMSFWLGEGELAAQRQEIRRQGLTWKRVMQARLLLANGKNYGNEKADSTGNNTVGELSKKYEPYDRRRVLQAALEQTILYAQQLYQTALHQSLTSLEGEQLIQLRDMSRNIRRGRYLDWVDNLEQQNALYQQLHTLDATLADTQSIVGRAKAGVWPASPRRWKKFVATVGAVINSPGYFHAWFSQTINAYFVDGFSRSWEKPSRYTVPWFVARLFFGAINLAIYGVARAWDFMLGWIPAAFNHKSFSLTLGGVGMMIAGVILFSSGPIGLILLVSGAVIAGIFAVVSYYEHQEPQQILESLVGSETSSPPQGNPSVFAERLLTVLEAYPEKFPYLPVTMYRELLTEAIAKLDPAPPGGSLELYVLQQMVYNIQRQVESALLPPAAAAAARETLARSKSLPSPRPLSLEQQRGIKIQQLLASIDNRILGSVDKDLYYILDHYRLTPGNTEIKNYRYVQALIRLFPPYSRYTAQHFTPTSLLHMHQMLQILGNEQLEQLGKPLTLLAWHLQSIAIKNPSVAVEVGKFRGDPIPDTIWQGALAAMPLTPEEVEKVYKCSLEAKQEKILEVTAAVATVKKLPDRKQPGNSPSPLPRDASFATTSSSPVQKLIELAPTISEEDDFIPMVFNAGHVMVLQQQLEILQGKEIEPDTQQWGELAERLRNAYNSAPLDEVGLILRTEIINMFNKNKQLGNLDSLVLATPSRTRSGTPGASARNSVRTSARSTPVSPQGKRLFFSPTPSLSPSPALKMGTPTSPKSKRASWFAKHSRPYYPTTIR